MSVFSDTILANKYLNKDIGEKSWDDIARRVAREVVKPYMPSYEYDVYKMIASKKLMPGGRYLYASGRKYNQINNCFSGDTKIITDKGVRSLYELVHHTDGKVNVLNINGEWEEATARSFGAQELYEMVFSNGTTVLTTENHQWFDMDGNRVNTLEIDRVPLNEFKFFPELDIEGIRHGIIYGDGFTVKHRHSNSPIYSKIVFVNPDKDESLVQYFDQEERSITVGFGAKITVNTIRKTKAGTVVSLQPLHYKELPRTYSPSYARGFIAGLIATDGNVSSSGSVTIACEGLEKAETIANIARVGGCVVSSVRINSTVNPYGGSERQLCFIYIKPYSAPIILPSHLEIYGNKNHKKKQMYLDVESVTNTGLVDEVYCIVAPKTHSFTLANGVITSNCFLFDVEDTKESWADLNRRVTHSLMTGAGIGVVYSKVREEGAKIAGMGGLSTGPIALMQMVNEIGRHVMQGGSRRSALWAGLHWNHKDIFKFIALKNWSDEVKALKAKDFNFHAPMDGTNISVILDDDFFTAYNNEAHKDHALAKEVYWKVVYQMCSTGEPR